MGLVSSPVPACERRFELTATEGVRIHARLFGRCPHRGLWIADRVETTEGSDPVESHRAFARAFAATCGATGGDVLVIESAETLGWRDALTGEGFRPAMRKVFVERPLDGELPPAPAEWRLRSLAETGEPEFIRRLAEVAEGDPFEERRTGARDLDAEWRDLLESAGSRFDPALWKLADDALGPIGVLLPQAVNGETGTLFYLGVVPPRRGGGLGRQIHALGLRLLAARGLRRYVGSTDVRNAAMRAVFERNGAPVVGTEAYFRRGGTPADS